MDGRALPRTCDFGGGTMGWQVVTLLWQFEEVIMKSSLAFLIVGAFAAGSLHAIAAMQTQGTVASDSPPPGIGQESRSVRTADSGYGAIQPIPLEPQTVQSQGGSLRPGPHNRHLTPPHGGPLHSNARLDVPGRS